MRHWLLPMLILAATALFVVGVAVERNSGDRHVEASSSTPASGGEGEAAHSQGKETGAESQEHAAKPAGREGGEASGDKLLGIDVESTSLVALAAVASMGLALGVWLRPTWAALLSLTAVALVAFAALDIREVFHQLDENKGGLAALAALVAALHLAAGGTGASQRRHTATR